MTDFEKALMKRDGMSEDEAHEELMNVRDELGSGGYDYDEIQDYLMDEYGLEPDYIEDIFG